MQPNPPDTRGAAAEPSTGRPALDPAVSPVDRAAVVERILERYEQLMSRLVTGHAPEFTELAITMAQAKVLYVVQAAGAIGMSDLAARLGVSLSTASGVVDRLVDLGFLERRTDPSDRRLVRVATTPAAHEHLERFRELNARELRELLGRVDDADLPLVAGPRDVLTAAAPSPDANGLTRGEAGQ